MEDIVTKIAWKRKLLSLVVFLFALLYYFTDATFFICFLLIMFALFSFFDVIHYISKGKNMFAKYFFKVYPKKKEELNVLFTDATLFFLCTLIMCLFFQKDAVVFSLIMLTFVDAGEQIFGILIKSKPLPWNPKKNYSGTFSGFLIGLVVSCISIIFLFNTVPLWIIFPTSFVAAIAGTSKQYDNILIPWAVAIVLTVLIYI